MSPIPSVVSTFTLSAVTPSAALDPNSVGHSASATSRRLLGTGGLLFAAVALVSIAGYFYRGRGTAGKARPSNTWVSLGSLLSSMRPRCSAATSMAAVTNWPLDLEVGFEHVNMVYARHFHPTFWNLVECHPATPSAPAIHVEDEANWIPVCDARPPGMNSFLDMDEDAGAKDARKKLDCKEVAPYDTSSPIDVNFSNDIIGTTLRPGVFLSVPGGPEDSSEPEPSDSEEDLALSPYDGIVVTDIEDNSSCSPYDGITMSRPRSSSGTRRYGVADPSRFTLRQKDSVPEKSYALVPTIACQTGLADLLNFVEPNLNPSYKPMGRCGHVGDAHTISTCDIETRDSGSGLEDGPSDVETMLVPHEGPVLMRILLAEFRDPDLDCTPRCLSEDSDSEYCDDGEDEDASIQYPTRLCFPHDARRNSLESTITLGADSDISDEWPMYPLTPPPKPVSLPTGILDVHTTYISPPFVQDVSLMSPTSLDWLPSPPSKARVHSHRDGRLLLFGPRVPLARLPRL